MHYMHNLEERLRAVEMLLSVILPDHPRLASIVASFEAGWPTILDDQLPAIGREEAALTAHDAILKILTAATRIATETGRPDREPSE